MPSGEEEPTGKQAPQSRTFGITRRQATGIAALALSVGVIALVIPHVVGRPAGNGQPSVPSLPFGALVDDTSFLQVIKFTEPVSVRVPLSVGDETSKPLIAAVSKAGIIWPVYKLDQAPWWEFHEPVGIEHALDAPLVPIGTRQISGRSEQRSWSEGATQYYAETITYSIVPVDAFKKAGVTNFGSYSIRVVFQNDPAAGHWQYQSDPLHPGIGEPEPAERDGVQQGLLTFGRQHLADLDAAIKAAVQTTAEATLHNVQALGQMEPDTQNPAVAVSRIHHLAFYTHLQPFQTASLNQLVRYCQGIRVPRYGPWRLAMGDELPYLFGSPPTMNQGGFIDSPVGGLLGDLERPSPDQRPFILISGTVHDLNGNYAPNALPAQLTMNSGVAGMSAQTSGADFSGTVLGFEGGADVQNQTLDFRKSFSEGRVVCVASLP